MDYQKTAMWRSSEKQPDLIFQNLMEMLPELQRMVTWLPPEMLKVMTWQLRGILLERLCLEYLKTVTWHLMEMLPELPKLVKWHPPELLQAMTSWLLVMLPGLTSHHLT